MTYRQVLKYLDSFINYEKKTRYGYSSAFKLDRFLALLELAGNPQHGLKCLHVAGTKGKGSACVFAAYILREAGYKVGLYTSPHLFDVRERIRVLKPEGEALRHDKSCSWDSHNFEGMIPKESLAGLIKRLRPAIARYQRKPCFGRLSFFEIYTLLAFAYFKEQKTDFAVLETGLGGRLDATNVIDPIACGITSISFDHMQKLGRTLAAIASEKAGIIKSSPDGPLPVISAPQDPEALSVIKSKCRRQGAILYRVGRDIIVSGKKSGNQMQVFSISGALGDISNLSLRLAGRHQLDNAAVAAGMILALQKFRGLKIKPGAFAKGFARAVWPGRFEVLRMGTAQKTEVVLDGAHNAASALALHNTLRKLYAQRPVLLIIGISRDKDVKGIFQHLLPIARKVIFTRADNPRALKPAELKAIAGKGDYLAVGDIKTALRKAFEMAAKDDIILVTGSLFVVAEAGYLLHKEQ